MAKYRKNSTVSVGLVKILNAYANRLGVDFKKVAIFCGFNMSILKNSEARISSKSFESMWLKIVSLSKDPYPGLNFGRQMARHYPGGSVLFTMMLNCDNIEKALQVFVRYHRIIADIIQPQFQITGEFTHLSWEIASPDFQPQPHLSEALLCTYYSILSFLSKGRLTLVKVCFTHVGPSDPDGKNEYQQVFNAPIIFKENKNELVIETKDLDIKIELANQELYKVLERHATRLVNTMPKEKEWSNRVLRLISDVIFKGDIPDIDSISQRLAVSKRALQEKLKVEKTNYRTLLETTRKQMAVDNLAKQDVTICEVAFILGYSDQSAFNHAFKRWTGQTPKAYIQKLT
ncbi:MAG: AraC family transcriptional regulator [Deltaproteobacteria bacterium]|nr:AraC family transcriptional regulator [Deltaproteobacteria bacterium]